MSFDRVFLGADTVTAEDGICEADHAQTRIKELMARRARDGMRKACILITVTETLFDFGSTDGPNNAGQAHVPIRDDQVVTIREAFLAAGITGQEQRQQIVQSTSTRSIRSLREPYALEAHRVLQRIKQHAKATPRAEGACAWNLREEDTWIDKL